MFLSSKEKAVITDHQREMLFEKQCIIVRMKHDKYI